MKGTDALFEDRLPAAAAIQLATVLADAAERLLEIAEEAEARKGTPLYLKQEYHSNAGVIARQCIDMKVPPRGLSGRDCRRLEKYMADVEKNKARCARLAGTPPEGHRP